MVENKLQKKRLANFPYKFTFLIILFITAVVIPLVLLLIPIPSTAAPPQQQPSETENQSSVTIYLSDSPASAMYAISFAAFSASSMLYIFFLEKSDHIHRGYRRKRLALGHPSILFIVQFIYVVLAAFLYKFSKSVFIIHYYTLGFILTSSLLMCTIAVLSTWHLYLDKTLLWHFKRLLKKRQRFYKQHPHIGDNSLIKNKMIETNISKTLSKVAVDIGCDYAKMKSSSLDKYINDISKNLISHIRDVSKIVNKGYPNNTEIGYNITNTFTVYTAYTYFYNITQNLYLGYRDKRGKEKDINFLIGMFKSLYSTISMHLLVLKDEDAKAGIQEYEIYTLTILVSVICCIVESLNDFGADRFFTKLNENQFKDKGLFKKLIYILYARGYFLSVNIQDKSSLPQRYFRNVHKLSSRYEESTTKDIRVFWQIWQRFDDCIPHNSATYLNRLTSAFERHYNGSKQTDENDTISLLLFGIKDKEY